jgi:hypothetical protein
MVSIKPATGQASSVNTKVTTETAHYLLSTALSAESFGEVARPGHIGV